MVEASFLPHYSGNHWYAPYIFNFRNMAGDQDFLRNRKTAIISLKLYHYFFMLFYAWIELKWSLRNASRDIILHAII